MRRAVKYLIILILSAFPVLAFDVSNAIGFYNNTCANAGISSEAPSITNTFNQ